MVHPVFTNKASKTVMAIKPLNSVWREYHYLTEEGSYNIIIITSSTEEKPLSKCKVNYFNLSYQFIILK
jgi:hypothetical protein